MFSKNIFNSTLVLFFSLFIANLVLINLPLFNSIGYEYSLVNGVLLYFIGAIFLLITFRSTKFNSLFDFLWINKGKLFFFYSIPLAISFYSTIFHSKCPLKDGIEFYFILTLFSFLFGLVIAFLSEQIHHKISVLIFIIITSLLLLSSFLEFYTQPQIYLYNPIFGLFPGTIYDEDVAVNIQLVLFQFYYTLTFLLLLFVDKLISNFSSRRFLKLLAFVVVLILSFLLKPFFGFATNYKVIDENLGKKITTANFTIYFDRRINNNEARIISLLHEYYFQRNEDKLQLKYTNKIESFIFYDEIQKRKLFGAGNADVSKPWLNQIYLNRKDVDRTLKHEIAHIISSKFGTTIFKVADGINPAMIEGLAMYAEDDFDGYPIEYGAALSMKYLKNISPSKIFSGFNFFTSYSSVSYIISGAFIKYLANNYGIEKVKNNYKKLDFDKNYNKNIYQLENEFITYLNSLNIQINPFEAQLYFGGQTIFRKYCPRMSSNEIKIANQLFNSKHYSLAYKRYREIYNYSGTYQSLVGLIYSAIKLDRLTKSKELLDIEMKKFINSQYYFRLELLLAEVNILQKDIEEAKNEFELLLQQKPHIAYNIEINLYSEILNNMGIDSLIGYYKKSFNEKNAFLLRNINKNNFPIYVNKLVQYSDLNNEILSDIIIKNIDNFSVEDYYSQNTSINISNYYFWRGNFALAKDFAVKALNYKTNDYLMYRAIENLRKVNWFVNFANEIKQYDE